MSVAAGAWVAAAVLSVATFGILAVALVRKGIALLLAGTELLGRTAILDGVHRAELEPRAEPAVLAGLPAASSRWRAARHRSRELRSGRRATRLTRGRALVTADAASIQRFQR